MDIQQYIALDKKLLLNLNGSNSLFWDGFMWVATSTYIWIPTAIILLYIIIKNNKIQETLLTIAMIALVITLADQIASGVCKPYFHRFRPTQDPDIMYILSLLFKNKSLTFMLIFWATLNSYSRIYLGVHYPGDILFGTLAGCLIGYLMYLLYSFIHKRIFHQPRCISNKYTASGYLINDINLLFTVLLLTYFMIILLGFITAHTLNL